MSELTELGKIGLVPTELIEKGRKQQIKKIFQIIASLLALRGD